MLSIMLNQNSYMIFFINLKIGKTWKKCCKIFLNITKIIKIYRENYK